MNVTWESAGVILAMIVAGNSLAVFVTRLIIRDETARNNDTLLIRINGTYVKSEVAAVRFEQATTRMSAIEARIAVLETLARSDS